MMKDISTVMYSLSKSKFRSRFHLSDKEISYIDNKGMDEIRKHCEEFIKKRLAPANIPNDGHQTPMKSHPVFIAQHATATCCRGCLYKWHKIEKGRNLTNDEIEYIVNLIMKFIQKEYDINKQNRAI